MAVGHFVAELEQKMMKKGSNNPKATAFADLIPETPEIPMCQRCGKFIPNFSIASRKLKVWQKCRCKIPKYPNRVPAFSADFMIGALFGFVAGQFLNSKPKRRGKR